MPPLTPEQLGEISVRLEKLTRAFEDTVLEDISRRIAKAGSITDIAEWQLIRLKEMGYASDFLEKAAADYTAKSQEEIGQLFFDAAQISEDFYAEVYSQAGKGFTPLAENQYMQQLIEAGIAQTENELKNFTRSMGFRMKNPDGTVSFKPAAKAYQDALDLAQMQVSTGVFDYNTAVRNAVRTLAESGLRFVDYETGHVNHADVAVRRAVLTGVSQMSGKISESNATELDTDIVEVTAHAGARPDHAEWQGRWYSLSGKSKKYPSLVEVTGYGTGAGLKGWNCRHDMYPVIEGISVPSYTEEDLKNIDPPPIEYDGKTYTYYECTQRQRRIETAIRKTKREVISAKASDDEEMFTAKSVLLRRQREEYEKFSSAAGLLTQKERTQAYGFDRSISAKASWMARKALDKSGGSGIINAKEVSHLEQAKKRDHKINITDIAINNVGKVKLSDFTDNQINDMQIKHKELLKIAKEKNDSNEVLFIDDLNFKSEVQILGDEFSVSPASNPFAVSVIINAERQSLIYLHNHPSTNNFSIGDIDTFVCERTIKAMSVVTNQGKVYVLNKTKNYDYNKTRNLLSDIFNSFDDKEIDNNEFVKRFIKRCNEGGIEYAKSK